jgi:predicted O-linked N-acetylglucosamine transferase (SPINDLY family)
VFHYTGDLKITECAAAIKSAQLDILIDLNGYSRWRRLPVYALHPAPVIASWFNSYATTGLSAIDYLIGDSVVAPPHEDEFYTEGILRVGGSYLTFEVLYPVPQVTPPPCLKNARITFGCLASLYKITPMVIAAWSRILHEAPLSTLLLKNGALGSSANREYLLHAFAQHGIPASRLQLEGASDHFEFLQTYDKIDIALDTFPYNGGTTTTEAIWQGVPVITFYGDRWASRTSASILSGYLNQFIASNLDTYIFTAVNLANESATTEMLAELRPTMRDLLRASTLCDTPSFARRMECLYRNMHSGH